MKIIILNETPEYLVISKPVGISVHAGAGERQVTISNWLVKKCPAIQKLPWKTKDRIGIVHRLDKDTSGVLLLAKTPEALDFYQDQFKNRTVEKHYQTLVCGKPPAANGLIDAFISRDPKDRKRQRTEYINFELDEAEKKFSATKYQTIKTYYYKKQPLTLLDVKLNTGRKHQIRAHMKHEGCPVIGDQKYFTKPSKKLSHELGITRQFLHATTLKFRTYPNNSVLTMKDNLPEELSSLLSKLSTI